MRNTLKHNFRNRFRPFRVVVFGKFDSAALRTVYYSCMLAASLDQNPLPHLLSAQRESNCIQVAGNATIPTQTNSWTNTYVNPCRFSHAPSYPSLLAMLVLAALFLPSDNDGYSDHPDYEHGMLPTAGDDFPDFDDDMMPTAEDLINVNVTCNSSFPGASSSPCSEDSMCLDGALGVYCLCYVRESTLEQVPDDVVCCSPQTHWSNHQSKPGNESRRCTPRGMVWKALCDASAYSLLRRFLHTDCVVMWVYSLEKIHLATETATDYRHASCCEVSALSFLSLSPARPVFQF